VPRGTQQEKSGEKLWRGEVLPLDRSLLTLQRHLISRTRLVLAFGELLLLAHLECSRIVVGATFLASGGKNCSRGRRVKDRLLVAWTMAFLRMKLRP
jgi:hypothetical protein